MKKNEYQIPLFAILHFNQIYIPSMIFKFVIQFFLEYLGE